MLCRQSGGGPLEALTYDDQIRERGLLQVDEQRQILAQRPNWHHPHVGAAAVSHLDYALSFQMAHGFAYDHPTHAELPCELAFARYTGADGELAGADVLLDLERDMLVGSSGRDLAEHAALLPREV